MKKLPAVVLALFIGVVITGCAQSSKNAPKEIAKENGTPQATAIIVSAAASLKDALGEIQKMYAEQKPGIKVIYNFGSSGTLQQQIEQGAPVDLFISAGRNQMDELERKNLIIKETRANLLGNDLVLVTGKENNTIKGFRELVKPEVKNIGIGNPETVPAGKYAQEALTFMKLWDPVMPKLVRAKDVRQVLAYVETGNAEAGLVYRSDALNSDKVKITAVAPAGSHKPIVYPAAVIKTAKNGAAAQEFLRFLQRREAMGVFVKSGFKSLDRASH